MLLTTNYGYEIPDDIMLDPQFLKLYNEAMKSVKSLDDLEISQYITPLGFLHRSMFIMDLQELYYVTELRSKPQGHISYRRIAYRMYELAAERFPRLMSWANLVDPKEQGSHI
jgi:thymidylate synthase ThyX